MYLMLSTKQGCSPLQLVFFIVLLMTIGNVRKNRKIKNEKTVISQAIWFYIQKTQESLGILEFIRIQKDCWIH